MQLNERFTFRLHHFFVFYFLFKGGALTDSFSVFFGKVFFFACFAYLAYKEEINKRNISVFGEKQEINEIGFLNVLKAIVLVKKS